MIHRNRKLTLALTGLALIAGCASPDNNGSMQSAFSESADVWTTDSFEDFSKGTLGDGGVNTYVAADGSVQLVNRFDLNKDGYIDLVMANSHPQAEKLDQSIFWGNGKDFDAVRMTLVPNEGAQWTVAADLNGDGKTDAVSPGYANGTWSKMPSTIYYGDPEKVQKDAQSAEWANYPFAKKISLPTEAAQQAAVGDLNKDGHPDIVIAISSGFWEYRGASAISKPSRIFWGSKDGYNAEKFQEIEANGASDVAVGDLNGDGWLDIVLANREKAGTGDTDSFVYMGGAEGFSPQRRSGLPTRLVNAVALADVNGDKALDILFANGEGDVSYIYLNQNGSFSSGNRIELPTSEARDVAAADLNGDGSADIFFTNHQTAGNRLTKSYLYFNDGSGKFSQEKRQEFETVGAWGVSIADLNKDQKNDIVVSNFQEHESFEVPSYIFWNSDKGFDQTRRTSLFTKGAVGNTVADFNNDGHLDVCFNNTSNRWRGGVAPAYVYWGRRDGKYSTDQMLKLPSVEPYDWAGGDLNNDGWPDLIIANMAEIGRRITENFIYWGGPEGYSPERRTALMGKGTRGVSVADLDKNGWLDVICLNTAYPVGDKDLSMYIYWGEPTGFVTDKRTELKSAANGLPLAADLNYDSNLDLIIAGGTEPSWIYWGDGSRNYADTRKYEVPESKGASSSEVADMNKDGWLDLLLMGRGEGEKTPSYVYYGNEKGEFSEERRNIFKPTETQGVTVADVNGDGWLDVIAPRYKAGGSRATMSRIYFGSSSGLSEDNIQELPTNAGTGSQVSDYDGDGYVDLLLYCHRSEGDANKPGRYGDHTTESYLYWGGPKGFDFSRKHLIPAEGVHYDGGIDLGNIADRSLEFDYISPPYHYGSRKFKGIDIDAQTPHGSLVLAQIRTASDEKSLESAQWMGPGSGREAYVWRVPQEHSWIQYRAILSTPNGGAAPVLEMVSIGFE